MRIQRSVLILLGGAGGILVAGILVALAAARQPAASYPANSPQKTVATYLQLLQTGKVDRAYALVSMDAPSAMQPAMSLQDFHQQYNNWGRTAHRVTLLHSDTNADTASVTVEIAAFSAGPFGASDQSSVQTFTLLRLNGAWRITGPAYFYP